MPLEIRELVIRVNVTEDERKSADEKQLLTPAVRKELIEECKAEVIAYLDKLSDR